MDTDGTRLRRRTMRVWFLVGLLALVWAAWQVAGPILGIVVPPLLLAVILIYLLNPLVGGFARLGLHRFVGTALSYLLIVAVVGVPITLGLPLLSEQATSIWEQAPETINALIADAETWLDQRGVALGLNTDLETQTLPELDAIFGNEESRSAIAAVLGGISGLATGLLRLLIVLVLGPVIAFYVLVDLPRLRDWSLRHIPPGYRIEATQVGQELSAVMGGYLRGQLLVALFVGSAVTLGMWLIDLPFWLVVGIVAGLTNLVPLLGPFVAGAIGGTIALANGGVSFALLVIVVLTVVQQMDNHLISPLVMGQSVQLHPLMVLFALLIAGTLYGFIGLLVAVPTVATGRVLAHHAWITRVPWAQDEPLPSPEADLTVTETAEAASAPLRRTV